MRPGSDGERDRCVPKAVRCERFELRRADGRVLLKVTDKGDYDWVECGSCEAGWQVAHYAESVG